MVHNHNYIIAINTSICSCICPRAVLPSDPILCANTARGLSQRRQRSNVSSGLLHIEQLLLQNEEKQTNAANE